MKKIFSTFFALTLALSTNIGLLAPSRVSANTTAPTLITIDNTASSNKSLYVSYSDYPGFGTTPTNEATGNSWWPKRSEGCDTLTTTKFKTLPWLPENDGLVEINPSLNYDGNDFKKSGDCTTRYWDGGSSSGAWLPAANYGGWANVGVLNWGLAKLTSPSLPTVNTSVYSDKLAAVSTPDSTLPDNQIWGMTSMYSTDQSVEMFRRNGFTSYTPSDGWNLFSSGTTLFRNEFNLTTDQINSLDSVNLYAIGDDWINVFVDGINIASAQTNNSDNLTKVTLTNNTTIKNILKAGGAGTHVIAFQVNDKARWFLGTTNSGTSSNNAGLSYKMDLVLTPTPSTEPTLSCSVTPESGLAPLVISVSTAYSTLTPATFNYDMNSDGNYEYTNRPSTVYYTYPQAGTYTVTVRHPATGRTAVCSPNAVSVTDPSDPDGGEVAP